MKCGGFLGLDDKGDGSITFVMQKKVRIIAGGSILLSTPSNSIHFWEERASRGCKLLQHVLQLLLWYTQMPIAVKCVRGGSPWDCIAAYLDGIIKVLEGV